MPTGPRLLVPGACYHINTRGNHRQKIFLDECDYRVFMGAMQRYKRKHGFLLYGFCLMPNHIHLVGEPRESLWLSKLMQGILRSYTAYFNKRYKKVGRLWQGRFKSKVIVKDGYLIDAIHYVELNPVRSGLVKTAGDYMWSGYRERVLDVVPDTILDQLIL